MNWCECKWVDSATNPNKNPTPEWRRIPACDRPLLTHLALPLSLSLPLSFDSLCTLLLLLFSLQFEFVFSGRIRMDSQLYAFYFNGSGTRRISPGFSHNNLICPVRPGMEEEEQETRLAGRQEGRQALNKVVDKGPRSRVRLAIVGYYANHLHSA